MPPADTLPNAALVDDPAIVSDKQLVSPSIFLIEGGEPVQVTFRNNFNCRTALMAACWSSVRTVEIRFRTFLHSAALSAAVTMKRSAIVAAIRSPAAKHGAATPVALSPRW